MEAFILTVCYKVINSDIDHCDRARIYAETIQQCGEIGWKVYEAFKTYKAVNKISIYEDPLYNCLAVRSLQIIKEGSIKVVEVK